MTVGSGERLRRLFEIIPRIADRVDVPIAELARDLGTSEGDVLRDLRELAERYDTPAGFVDGVNVVLDGDTVSVRTDHFHRPMRLTVAEVCALELGLSLLLHAADESRRAGREVLRAKLVKLITRLPQDGDLHGLRGGAHTGGAAAQALPVLRDALRKRRVVLLDYQRPSDGEATTRTVHPWRLIFSNGSWYLAGWCEESGGARIYRSDRIAQVAMTDRDADPEPADASDQLFVDGKALDRSSTAARLTVRYSPAIARWIEEREQGTVEPDGSLLVEYPLADREWAIRYVLQYGPDAQVVAPVEIREAVVERVREMAAKW